MQADSSVEPARLGGSGGSAEDFPITVGLRAWPECNEGALFVDRIHGGTAQAHTSVLDFYCQRYPHSASSQGWLDRIANGQVTLNGTRITDPATPLSLSDTLCYRRTPWQEPTAPCHFTVLFQDDHVLVLSKPGGLQVLRGAPFHQRTLLSLLALHARNCLVPVRPEAAEACGKCYGTTTQGARPAPAAALQSTQEHSLHARNRLLPVQPEAAAETCGEGYGTAAHTQGKAEALDRQTEASNELNGTPKAGNEEEGQCGIDWASDTMESAQGMASPTHRIGRGTSGLLICAISPVAKARLAADFAAATRGDAAPPTRHKGRRRGSSSSGSSGSSSSSGKESSSSMSRGNGSSSVESGSLGSGPRIVKYYRALVQGLMVPDEQTVRVPIGRVEYGSVVGGLFMAFPTGKPAVSVLRVLHRHSQANQTLLEVRIFSGRAHQIRIHCAAAGHPLVGDPLYVSGGVPAAIAGLLPEHGPDSAANCEDAAGASALLNNDNPAKDSGSSSSSSRSSIGMVDGSASTSSGSGTSSSTIRPGDTGYWLHSFRCLFHHPASNQVIQAVAPPPPALRMPHETHASFQPACQDMPPHAMMDAWQGFS
ncbi:hypothetical protein CLOP_g15210 [Closterium sp. NIES-67]|nr:hypothetical protein CLOP_g15210 [Closterium sp. NIES-67]